MFRSLCMLIADFSGKIGLIEDIIDDEGFSLFKGDHENVLDSDSSSWISVLRSALSST